MKQNILYHEMCFYLGRNGRKKGLFLFLGLKIEIFWKLQKKLSHEKIKTLEYENTERKIILSYHGKCTSAPINCDLLPLI